MQQRSIRTGLALLAALAVAVPVVAADRQFDRTLAVTGPVTLTVSTGSGRITVKVGDDRAVKVIGTVHPNVNWGGGSQADTDKAVETVLANPPIVQEGSAIRLGELGDKELGRLVSISFDVTVPRTTTVSARSGSGDVDLADLGGPATVQTGSGGVRVGRMGGAVKVQTGSGGVAVAGAKERIDVSTGSGDVRVSEVVGAATVRTGSGDVDVTQTAAGALELNSGSGDLLARGVTGPVTARSASGDVHLSGTPSSDWEVSTASGEIVLDVPDGSSFRVTARTSSGGITLDHATSSTNSTRRELDATVGHGGPTLSLRSASGDVSVRKGSGK